jgi:hypothetical protein
MADQNDAFGQWNVETARRYVLDRIEANDRLYQARFDSLEKASVIAFQAQQSALVAQERGVMIAMAAAEKAVTKAEVAADRRFEGVNELRGAMEDQQRNLMPRPEAESEIKALKVLLSALAARMDQIEGRKAGGAQGYGIAVGIIGLLVALIALAGRFLH